MVQRIGGDGEIVVLPLEGVLRLSVQTGLDPAVGGQADAVALCAEVGADGADEPDAALRVRQAEEPGHAVVPGGNERGQTFGHDRKGKEGTGDRQGVYGSAHA